MIIVFFVFLGALSAVGGPILAIPIIIIVCIISSKTTKNQEKEVKPTLNYKICAGIVLILLILGSISEALFGLGYIVYAGVLFMFFVQDVKDGQSFWPLFLKYAVMEVKAIFLAPFLVLIVLAQIAVLIPAPLTGQDLIDAIFIWDFFMN